MLKDNEVRGIEPTATDQESGHRRILLATVAISLLVAALIISLTKIGLASQTHLPQQPSQWVDLQEPAPATSAAVPSAIAGKPTLRVAIAPVISPEKTLGIYREFVDYLAESLGRSPVFLQRQTYAEINELLRNRRCDIALVCTYAFVRGEREFGMKALAIPKIRGAITYHSLILTPADSQARSLLDLRHKRFASADLLSSSGWLYPAVWLLEHNNNPDQYFSEHLITGSHDRSITSVAAQYVDGAAVDSLVYEQMIAADASLAAKVKIIDKSPAFGMPPLVVHPQIEPELCQAVLKALVAAHEHPTGRRALEKLGIEQFVPAQSADYERVRRTLATWEAGQP